MMVEVTDRALSEFKKILEIEDNKGLAIKIKAHVSQSCCSCGPSQAYEMGLVEEGEKGDELTDMDGVRFYMDAATSEAMKGYEVDFMDEQGFIVKDPSAPSCGCGGGDHEHGHGGHGGSCC